MPKVYLCWLWYDDYDATLVAVGSTAEKARDLCQRYEAATFPEDDGSAWALEWSAENTAPSSRGHEYHIGEMEVDAAV